METPMETMGFHRCSTMFLMTHSSAGFPNFNGDFPVVTGFNRLTDLTSDDDWGYPDRIRLPWDFLPMDRVFLRSARPSPWSTSSPCLAHRWTRPVSENAVPQKSNGLSTQKGYDICHDYGSHINYKSSRIVIEWSFWSYHKLSSIKTCFFPPSISPFGDTLAIFTHTHCRDDKPEPASIAATTFPQSCSCSKCFFLALDLSVFFFARSTGSSSELWLYRYDEWGAKELEVSQAHWKFESCWIWLLTTYISLNSHEISHKLPIAMQSQWWIRFPVHVLAEIDTWEVDGWFGGFHKFGGTPSHHPFVDGIFQCKPSSYWGTPFMETHICLSSRLRLIMTTFW